jgi:hypothetical protein
MSICRYIYVYREQTTEHPVYVGSAFDVDARDRVHSTSNELPFDREITRRDRSTFTLHVVDSVVGETAIEATALAVPLENEWMDRLSTFRTPRGFNFARAYVQYSSEEHRAAGLAAQAASAKKAWTEEMRASNSAMQKELQNRPDVKERNAAKQKDAQTRPDVVAKKSAAAKARWTDPEYRERVLAAQVAGSTPEVRARQRASSIAKRALPEVKERHRAATVLGRTPEVIARQAATLKARWANDPDYRLRMSLAHRKNTGESCAI